MNPNNSQRKRGPKVKRATDKAHVDPNKDEKGTATGTTNWTEGEGGNVVQWLTQQTKQPERSKGALDYLNKKSKNDTTKGKGEEKKKTDIPKPRSSAKKSSREAEKPEKEASKVPTSKDAPEGKHREERENPRGRRRRGSHRNNREEYEKRQREREEEARRRHEEAMKNDPEYQKNFQSLQERQEAMQVSYQRYCGEYATQQNIVVDGYVAERLDIPLILNLVEQHDVVFICTDTGSGKSTTIPKALLELSTETRVVSTQPRRTATISIATRVAQLRREIVGEDVGYWIRGEKKGDEQTRLWYMTSYTLLLQLLEDPSKIPYTHIVLDEFHEQQPDIEVMVALLRLSLLKGRGKFKLILMSATLNTMDWEQYFEGLKVATYKQSEPEHPIHDYFLEDVCSLLGADYTPPAALMEKDFVEKKIVNDHMSIAEYLVGFINGNSYPHHSILVFLPGRAQVEEMQISLERRLQGRVYVVPWHSAVDLSQIETAIHRNIPGRQKVYLATDIAEVSITLPDVVFVIDLVLVKRPKITKEIPASLLYPPLVTQWISKGSVAQRRGRVGRVQQGFYFCLFPAGQIPSLRDHAQAPIENSRIDELSLHTLQVVSNPVAIFSICHSQPLAETIASSMNTLTELGCIIDKQDPSVQREVALSDPVSGGESWSKEILSSAEKEAMTGIDEYQCTFIGRILQLIPVSPQPGMLVFYGLLCGMESLMILAAAVTSSLSPFAVASGTRNLARAMEETENVMRDMCCGLRSDIVAVMKAVLLFRIEMDRNGEDEQTIRQWCTQKQLSSDKLLGIVDLYNHIKQELSDFLPFGDIEDPSKLLEQLEKLAPMVSVMTNVAFVAHAVEVTSDGTSSFKSKETAVGIFSELSAVPDIHSPSCLRWQEGDIIIPVQLNLLFDKLLASFSTAIASHKQFWMSLLLFTYRVNYATFSDDAGTFYVFSVRYCGKERFLEVDDIGGVAVLDFRRRLNSICKVLRLSHLLKAEEEEVFAAACEKHNLKSLPNAQRDVITALVTIFKNLESMSVDDVEHEEDDLDIVSILSFALDTN